VTVSGPGAGRIETAYALLSDIIAIHRAAADCSAGSHTAAGSVEAAKEDGGLARV